MRFTPSGNIVLDVRDHWISKVFVVIPHHVLRLMAFLVLALQLLADPLLYTHVSLATMSGCKIGDVTGTASAHLYGECSVNGRPLWGGDLAADASFGSLSVALEAYGADAVVQASYSDTLRVSQQFDGLLVALSWLVTGGGPADDGSYATFDFSVHSEGERLAGTEIIVRHAARPTSEIVTTPFMPISRDHPFSFTAGINAFSEANRYMVYGQVSAQFSGLTYQIDPPAHFDSPEPSTLLLLTTLLVFGAAFRRWRKCW